MRVAAYVRHSGNRSQVENLSLATQERLLRDYAARQGWPEPETFSEARSAFTDDLEKRPVFARLVAAIERGEFAMLLIYDQDRLARDASLALLVANRLTRAGCQIVLINQPNADVTTPDGKMMYTFGAGIAEYYSSQISRKSKAGLAEVRARGGHVGGLPYGTYRDDEHRLRIDPSRAEAMRLILTMAVDHSYNAIAAALDARGIAPPRRRSARWRETSIRAWIKTGRWLLDQPDPWPALWVAAHDRPRVAHGSPTKARHELAGFLRCACGGNIVYSGYYRLRRTGGRDYGIQCRSWSALRDTVYHCPKGGKTKARHYEEEAARQLLAMPDLTRVELAPVDVRAARREIEERRLALARAVALRLPADEAAALAAEIDRDEALLPLDSGTEREIANTLRLAQWRWHTLTPGERNAEWRNLVARMVVDGTTLAIEWVPPIARLLAQWQRDKENAPKTPTR